MSYWRLFYHIIWATWMREPLLTREREKVFRSVLFEKAKKFQVIVHAVGNTEDHIHILVSIPPVTAIAKFIQEVKGASSYTINQLTVQDGQFKWQDSYGVFSLGEKSVETVKKYVLRQKEHHQEQTTISLFETDEPNL
jgi:putative transposase